MKNTLVILPLLLTLVHGGTGTLTPNDPPAPAASAATHPSVSFAVMPLLGTVGNMMGVGMDVSVGIGHLAFGVRYAGGAELCIDCGRNPRTESGASLLLGARQEFPIGVISVRSGIALADRGTEDHRIEGALVKGTSQHDGLSVPLTLDLVLGSRYFGLSLSGTVMADGDGGSSAFMIGLPFGKLRK